MMSSSSSAAPRKKGTKQKKKTGSNHSGLRQPVFAIGMGALTFQPKFKINNDIFRVTQSQQAVGVANSSTVAATFTGNYVTAAGFDQFASFAAVFDQYKIDELEVTFMPQVTEGFNGSNAGLFTLVVDNDDSTLLTSVAAAMDYPAQQTVRGSDMVRVTFKPRIAVAAYSGSFASYANTASWIDCSSSTVQHYGWKTAWTSTSVAMSYNVIIRVNLSFRQVR